MAAADRHVQLLDKWTPLLLLWRNHGFQKQCWFYWASNAPASIHTDSVLSAAPVAQQPSCLATNLRLPLQIPCVIFMHFHDIILRLLWGLLISVLYTLCSPQFCSDHAKVAYVIWLLSRESLARVSPLWDKAIYLCHP